MTESHPYIVLVNLDSSSRPQRIQIDVPTIISSIKSRSNDGNAELLCRSADNLTFAFLIRSDLKPGQICGPFDSDMSVHNGDKIFVATLTGAASSLRMSRAESWLAKHLRPKP